MKKLNDIKDLESTYEEKYNLFQDYKSKFLMEVDQCRSIQAKEEVIIRHWGIVHRAINNPIGEHLKKMIFSDEVSDLKILKDNAETFPAEVIKNLEENYEVLKKSDFKKLSPGIKENISLDAIFCIQSGALGKTTKDANAGIYSLIAIKKLKEYFEDYIETNNMFDHESDKAFKEHVINNCAFPAKTTYSTAIVISNELKILNMLEKQNKIDEFVTLIASIYKVEKNSVESGLKGMMDPKSKAYCYNKKNVVYASNYLRKLGYLNNSDVLKKRYPEYFKE